MKRKNKWLAWLLVVMLFCSTFLTNLQVTFASESEVSESTQDEENEIVLSEGSHYIASINKDGLTQAIDELNESPLKEKLLAKSYVLDAYEHAVAVLDDTESEQEDVDAAQSVLEDAVSVAEHLENSLAYLVNKVTNPSFGTGGGEWTILSLARADYDVPQGYYDLYYENVEQKVIELIEKNSGVLDKNKSTEHSRLILGLTSIGRDIYNVAGNNIIAPLSDFNYLKRQGLNGPIFTLIALNTHQYSLLTNESETEQATVEKLIEHILNAEIKKDTDSAGGWALGTTAADPDMTAMAMQALAPYYETNSEVRAAVDRAVMWLSSSQIDNGGYKSWGSDNSQSSAQVIVALTAIGIDPHLDERFIKNGSSVVDALMNFAVPGGGFKNVQAYGIDGMATDQGTYALVAYDRFLQGMNSLFDMNDVVIEKGDDTEAPGEETENPDEGEVEIPDDNHKQIGIPEHDTPEIEIDDDGKSYEIAITAADENKEVSIVIPEQKEEAVSIHVSPEVKLPQLTASKGQLSISIPQGTTIVTSDTSSIELLSTSSIDIEILKQQLDTIIAANKKLDNITAAIHMGGLSKIQFDSFVTIKFAGAAGQNAAYIQDDNIKAIDKFASKAKGIESGKTEFAYDDGEDLIVETKHFTDFIAYSTKPVQEAGNGGNNGATTSTVTLSVDKLTINKGHVLSPTVVELQSGDTAWSVFQRVLDSKNISYEYEWNEEFGSIYVQSIDGDGEFDHGDLSGWMYNVNGWYPNYGADRYIVKAGDSIEWRFTTNLGRDLGVAFEEDKEALDDEKTPSDESSGEQENAKPEESAQPSIQELYSDYSEISSWALDAVQEATNYGFIQGSNGKFHAKSFITRAEFTKILVSVLKLDTTIDQSIAFTDVADDAWFYPYVNAAYKKGLITGYEDKFKPNETITREEMAVIIARALELKADSSTNSLNNSDKVSSWAKQAVEAIVANGLMQGDATGFNPQGAVTREMAAVVAVRAYAYKQDSIAYQAAAEQAKVSNQLQSTASFLQTVVAEPTIASTGGDWTVFGLARSGAEVAPSYYSNYYEKVEQILKENVGQLHNVKYTEYDRVILALTSIGKDITNVAGYDLLQPLADFETLIKQGINGPIFALIALDSKNYEIPVVENVKTQTTRELLIQFILDREIKDGGWALGNNPITADPDITAMALQGLTPYYNSNAEVKAAVDRGLVWLSNAQQSNGDYTSWGAGNSESNAQVIVALTGLGIDPNKDSRFIKNDRSVVAALLSYAHVNGGFYHVKSGGEDNGGAKPGEVDLMATDQAFYALSAYDRFLTEKKRLYDMTDVK